MSATSTSSSARDKLLQFKTQVLAEVIVQREKTLLELNAAIQSEAQFSNPGGPLNPLNSNDSEAKLYTSSQQHHAFINSDSQQDSKQSQIQQRSHIIQHQQQPLQQQAQYQLELQRQKVQQIQRNHTANQQSQLLQAQHDATSASLRKNGGIYGTRQSVQIPAPPPAQPAVPLTAEQLEHQQHKSQYQQILTVIQSREKRNAVGAIGPPACIPRTKTHWDYVLDEMQFLAIDFRQELRWKMSVAKSLAEVCAEAVQVRKEEEALSVAGHGVNPHLSAGGRGRVRRNRGPDAPRTAEEWATDEARVNQENSLRIIAMRISTDVLRQWATFTGPNGRHQRILNMQALRKTRETETSDNSVTEFDNKNVSSVEESALESQVNVPVMTAGIEPPTPVAAMETVVSTLSAPAPASLAVHVGQSTTRKQMQTALAGAAHSTAQAEASASLAAVRALSAKPVAEAVFSFEKVDGIVSAALTAAESTKLSVNGNIENSSSTLLPHQRQAVARVAALNAAGLGALLHGPAFSGKTTAAIAVMNFWLDQSNPRTSPDAAGNSRPSCVIAFVSGKSLLRWESECARGPLNGKRVRIWSDRSVSREVTAVSEKDIPDIWICCIEDIADVLLSPSSPMHCPRRGAQGTLAHILGIVIDMRGVDGAALSLSLQCAFGRRILAGSPTEQLLTVLAGEVGWSTRGLTARRLLLHDSMPDSAHVPGIFALLIQHTLLEGEPATDIERADLITSEPARLRPEAVVLTKHWEKWIGECASSSIESSNKRPLALFGAMSVFISVSDSDVAASTRLTELEVIAEPMDELQRAVHDATVQTLLDCKAFSGSYKSIPLFTKGITLLRMVCFHESHIESKLSALSSADVPAVHQRLTLRDKLLAHGQEMQSNQNLSAKDAFLGSCKLAALPRYLQKYARKRVAIVSQSALEATAVSSALLALGTTHYFSGMHGDLSNNSPFAWQVSQAAIRDYNRLTSTGSPAVLVTTVSAFDGHGVLPLHVDVILLLSEDWFHPTNLNTCYRLRALALGTPLTVVRVVASGTLEEHIAATTKQGTGCMGILCLQNKPLGELNLLISSKSGSEGRKSETSVMNLLAEAPVLAGPVITPGPTHVNPFTSKVIDESEQQRWITAVRLALISTEKGFSALCSPQSIRTSANEADILDAFSPLPLHFARLAAAVATTALKVSNKSEKSAVLKASRSAYIEACSAANNEDGLWNADGADPGNVTIQAHRNSLRSQGVGSTETEKRLWMHMTPTGCNASSANQTSVFGISSSCAIAFRNALKYCQERGIPMDAHLYVNPIQNASRADTVAIPTFRRTAHCTEMVTDLSYSAPSEAGGMQRRVRPSTRVDVIGANRKRVLEQTAHTGLVTKKNRLETGEATAAALMAGTVWSYTAKPKTLLLLPQKSKSELDSINRQVWRQSEDDIMLVLQRIFIDPHFLLTSYVINHLPDTARGQEKLPKRVKERYEKVEKSPQSIELLAPEGRLAAISRELELLRDNAGGCVRGVVGNQGVLSFWKKVLAVCRACVPSSNIGLAPFVSTGLQSDDRTRQSGLLIQSVANPQNPINQTSARGLTIVNAATLMAQRSRIPMQLPIMPHQILQSIVPANVQTRAPSSFFVNKDYLSPSDMLLRSLTTQQ